jgi:hypothetical protein
MPARPMGACLLRHRRRHRPVQPRRPLELLAELLDIKPDTSSGFFAFRPCSALFGLPPGARQLSRTQAQYHETYCEAVAHPGNNPRSLRAFPGRHRCPTNPDRRADVGSPAYFPLTSQAAWAHPQAVPAAGAQLRRARQPGARYGDTEDPRTKRPKTL